jgi:hypothetical protein
MAQAMHFRLVAKMEVMAVLMWWMFAEKLQGVWSNNNNGSVLG